MPRSRRCSQAGWWPGQHHRRHSGGFGRQLNFRSLLICLLICAPGPLWPQSLLHIRIVEGEGAIHALSSKASRGIVVEITDETGRPVDAAAVSFRMPEEGPGATFEQGMRTEIRTTTPDGLASIRSFQTGSLKGPFQVRVTAVKNHVRAGTVVSQYVSESASPRRSIGPAEKSGGGRRWLVIAAVAGAAAAGAFAGMHGRGSATTAGTAGGVTPVPPPQIGTPSITIGAPQ